jgi:hypothetical protein
MCLSMSHIRQRGLSDPDLTATTLNKLNIAKAENFVQRMQHDCLCTWASIGTTPVLGPTPLDLSITLPSD